MSGHLTISRCKISKLEVPAATASPLAAGRFFNAAAGRFTGASWLLECNLDVTRNFWSGSQEPSPNLEDSPKFITRKIGGGLTQTDLVDLVKNSFFGNSL